MLRQKINCIVLLTVLSGTLFCSCKTAEMYQSEALLQSSKELPVTGRHTIRLRKDFSIGAFAVTGVRRGWKSSREHALGGLSSRRVNQRFEFVLQDSTGAHTYVRSQAGIDSKEIQMGNIFSIGLGGDDREILVSMIHLPHSSPWQLVTKDPGAHLTFKDFLGVLQKGDEEIMVEPVYAFKNPNRVASSAILGYEFKRGQEVLGAVQVLNKGKVWVKKDLDFDQQRLLSAAAASLLLYRKLDQPNPAEPQNARIKLPVSLLK